MARWREYLRWRHRLNAYLRRQLRGECELDEDPGRPRPRTVNTVTVFPGGVLAQRTKGGRGRVGGGPRGVIRGFSLASRRRLIEYLIRMAWPLYDFSLGHFTYHDRWGSRRDWKRDLRAFEKRLKRRWGHVLVDWIWREEFQGRGAPHFHDLFLWVKGRRPDAVLFERWCRWAWAEVIGTTGDVDALRHGVRVAEVGPRKGDLGRVLGYLLGEMGKVSQGHPVDPQTGEPLETGRMWGVGRNIELSEGEERPLTDEGFREFVRRVNRLGEDVRNRYMAAASPLWPGCRLLGAPEQMAGLLYALPGHY